MKKWFGLVLALVMTLVCAAGAFAAAVGAPTQDNVAAIEAKAVQAEGEEQAYELATMEATDDTVNALLEIIAYTESNGAPVARYFPEDVQKEIEAIAAAKGVDPETLNLSEFMSLSAPEAQAQTVETDVIFNTEYVPGTPVIAVLGVKGEEGVQWKALDADVMVMDTVSFDIPADVASAIAGKEVLFGLLSGKPGEDEAAAEFIPSISIGDMTVVEDDAAKALTIVGEPTEALKAEIEKMEEHIIAKQLPAMSFYTTEINRDVKEQLPAEYALSDLIPYEVVCVQANGEAEGDVVTKMDFVTPYADGQMVAALVGVPAEDGEVAWTAQDAQVKDGAVEVTFTADVLAAMKDQPALLVLMSTPVAE